MYDKSEQQMWAKIIAKAWLDKQFLEKLRENPSKVLKDEGFDIPKQIHYKVIEDTNDTVHIVIPNKPDGDLSEGELKKVTAATNTCTGCGSA